MTIAELERIVASHAPGSLIPRDWFLSQLQEVSVPDGAREGLLADLGVEEAGVVLGRSTSTVRDYARRGLLPGAYRQRGREWRVPRSAIVAFQRAEASPAGSAPSRRLHRAEPPNLAAWREELTGET